jgi:hypothetical protein
MTDKFINQSQLAGAAAVACSDLLGGNALIVKFSFPLPLFKLLDGSNIDCAHKQQRTNSNNYRLPNWLSGLM